MCKRNRKNAVLDGVNASVTSKRGKTYKQQPCVAYSPSIFSVNPKILYWWVYGSVRLGSPPTPLKITCVRVPHMLLVSNFTLSIASAEEKMVRRRKKVV